MDNNNFEVELYETWNGECPVEEFINTQNEEMQAKILKMFELLEERGNSLGMPYSEHLIDGIYQVRARIGNNISRVLYFFGMKRAIVMTNGFLKKTQRTPLKEIKKAKRYRADYVRRQKEIRHEKISGDIEG